MVPWNDDDVASQRLCPLKSVITSKICPAGQPMSAAQWASYLPGVSYHPPCQ